MADETTQAGEFEKATPRPWKAEINQSRTLAQIYGDGGTGNWVLNLEHEDMNGLPVAFDEEALANLALIVRAVNAYEPMRDVVKRMKDWMIQHPAGTLWSEAERDLLTDADAALRAADGEEK